MMKPQTPKRTPRRGMILQHSLLGDNDFTPFPRQYDQIVMDGRIL